MRFSVYLTRASLALIALLPFSMVQAHSDGEHVNLPNNETTGIFIQDDTVVSGTPFSVTIHPPEGVTFFFFRIFYNLEEPITGSSFNIRDGEGNLRGEYIQQVQVTEGQTEFSIDTFNFAEGTYYVSITYSSDQTYDSVEVTAAPVIETQTNDTGIFTEDGTLLSALFSPAAQPPVLVPDTPYLLQINTAEFESFDNLINVQYLTNEDALLDADIFRIKAVASEDLGTSFAPNTINVTATCGTQTDLSHLSNGISHVLFRTPEHLEYYETDGKFDFTFRGVPAAAGNCNEVEWTLETIWNDSPAAAAIPQAQVARDTIRARLVRIGRVGLSDIEDLNSLGNDMIAAFAQATKGYFELSLDPPLLFPLVQSGDHEQMIRDWWTQAPKTPDTQDLDLNDPDQLWLAAMAYYNYAVSENVFVNHLTSTYAPRSNGEDLTFYLFDGPGSLGQAMGTNGSRTKVARLYPGAAISRSIDGQRSYGFDPSNYAWMNTIDDMIQFLSDEINPQRIGNTTLHEIGHIGWVERVGVSTGDNQTQDFDLWESDFKQFITRGELMSYARDRTDLAGAMFGDDLLEELIAGYDAPVTLTLEVPLNGSISTDPDRTSFIFGETVQLTATPSAGYALSGWSGAASGSANPFELTMDDNKTVGATFGADLSDGDDDGLTTFDEVTIHSTNPQLKDTSGDGISDGDVVAAGFDPTTDFSALLDAHLANMRDARIGSVMLERNANNGTVTIQMQVERSDDLQNWTEDPDDMVEVDLNVPEGRRFLRFRAR